MNKIRILFFLIISSTYGQISGCTDAQAKNFNPNATNNDGSCAFTSIKIKAKTSLKLKDSLRETSGLIAFDHLLWTHNDDHDNTLYGLDSNGKIQKKIKLNKVKITTGRRFRKTAATSTLVILGIIFRVTERICTS